MRVLSGIRPTGEIHIGHYFGAIKQWLNLQRKYESYFFIADLHAITEPFKPVELSENVIKVAAGYIAAGLDPKKCSLFVQSRIPEHTELSWIFSTLLPMGELQRMTQYKDLVKKYGASINAGIFVYPALMAADILIYKANVVPVGEDQKQHVELARTIARKFNLKFGRVFPEPIAILDKTSLRLKSLTNPDKKMSKSDKPNSHIGLFDEPAIIRKKILSAVTDSGKEIKYDQKNKPAISNLLTIYHLFSGKPITAIEREYQNQGYAAFKSGLAELIIKKLSSIQAKQKKLLKSKTYLQRILDNGTKRARKIAQKTLQEVRQKMGLI